MPRSERGHCYGRRDYPRTPRAEAGGVAQGPHKAARGPPRRIGVREADSTIGLADKEKGGKEYGGLRTDPRAKRLSEGELEKKKKNSRLKRLFG